MVRKQVIGPRFAKSGKAAFIAGLFGFLIGNGVMIFSGMLGGLVFGTGDLIELMISMGIVFWALIILTLNIWTTNNATAYAFGMAGAELFQNNKKPFIIGGIIIALLMAIFGIFLTTSFLCLICLVLSFLHLAVPLSETTSLYRKDESLSWNM